jgi:hypothetical protein
MRFVKIQQAKHVWGWYLVIPTNDTDLMMRFHKSLCSGLFMRMQKDPHKDVDAVGLGAAWLGTFNKQMLNVAKELYVNRNGGMCCAPVEIIDEVERDSIYFPPEMEQYQKNTVEVKKWYGGTHYYLCSPTKLVFSQEKYDTLDEALAEARLHAPDENVKVIDANFQYMKDGD